jgi:hypothetical protein
MPAELGDGDMALVDDQQGVARQVVEQRQGLDLIVEQLHAHRLLVGLGGVETKRRVSSGGDLSFVGLN